MSSPQKNGATKTTTTATLLMWLLWAVVMAFLVFFDVGSTLPSYCSGSISSSSSQLIVGKQDAPSVDKQQKQPSENERSSSTSSLLTTSDHHANLPATKTELQFIRVAPYDGPQTTYQIYPHPFPCYQGDVEWKRPMTQKAPSKEGILYTRGYRTASDTFAGVLLGLAINKRSLVASMEDDQEKPIPCKHRLTTNHAFKMEFANRTKSKSFHVSLLRHPTTRIQSHFFHQLSYQEVVPTDENFMSFLQDSDQANSNYYAKDLSIREITKEELTDVSKHAQIVQDILDEYDFVAITERLDESLVVLKHLLGLDSLEDILYIPTQKSGTFTKAAGNECIYVIRPFVTEGMQAYFDSDAWKKDYMGVDFMLYQAAVASLDNTIDALGRDVIETEVTEFRQMLRVAEQKCASQTTYRCDAAGRRTPLGRTTCFLWGTACSYDCFESLRGSDWAAELDQLQES